jgi:hypothetical protein
LLPQVSYEPKGGQVIIETSDWPEPINTGALLSEIERLKAQLREYQQQGMSDIKDKAEELKLEVMKALLIRAADALEEEFGSPDAPEYGVKGPVHELIAELRKAAG